ncbi:MAG: CoA transferase [Chloroflexi bacterium]|nr:CoA transferase [Chloroflexota bacterium]
MSEDKPRALEGLTVIDLTRALAGPYATLLLAGLGARVIKVEEPHEGDGRENAPFMGRDGVSLRRQHPDDVPIANIVRLRGKQSITLNFKHPQAQAIFADLVRQADIVVENFSGGTAERLGIGYTSARAANARIIYCSISGFGQQNSGGKAMDNIIQALSGIMLATGGPQDPPVRIGIPTADTLTPLFGVIGILSALEQRHRTGTGQYIDVSMLGTLTSVVAVEPFDVLERLGIPMRTGPTVPRLAPFGVYPAADGYVVICAPGYRLLPALLGVMQRTDLLDDPRFSTQAGRLSNSEYVDAVVGEWTATLPKAEIAARLNAAGVAAAEVREPRVAIRDARVVARGETYKLRHPVYGDVDDVYGPGVPIGFSAASAELDPITPWLGEHNDEVYGDLLGYSRERVDQLKAEGGI